MREALLIALGLMGGVNARAAQLSPRDQAVEDFMGLISPRLSADEFGLAAGVRRRVDWLARETSRRTRFRRAFDGFFFVPRRDVDRRLNELAEAYLIHLDRAFTAHEAGRPQVQLHVARALEAVGVAYAWSTSTADVVEKPSRRALIRRYVVEAAITWGGIASTLGLTLAHGNGVSPVGAAISAAAALMQNLNFWWTARRAGRITPTPPDSLARARLRRDRFWAHVAEFINGETYSPVVIDPAAVASEHLTVLADLGAGLNQGCELWLAGKTSTPRWYK